MANFSAQRRLLLLLGTSLAVANGCKSKTEPAPEPPAVAATEPFDSESDIFSRSHGYWEWTRLGNARGIITPASVGYTRQLVFKGDSILRIYHNQQLEMQPVYHLHTGISRCFQVARPLVDFTAEAQITNDRIRAYTITRSTDTTLVIIGETECVDGGGLETYKWHHRR